MAVGRLKRHPSRCRAPAANIRGPMRHEFAEPPTTPGARSRREVALVFYPSPRRQSASSSDEPAGRQSHRRQHQGGWLGRSCHWLAGELVAFRPADSGRQTRGRIRRAQAPSTRAYPMIEDQPPPPGPGVRFSSMEIKIVSPGAQAFVPLLGNVMLRSKGPRHIPGGCGSGKQKLVNVRSVTVPVTAVNLFNTGFTHGSFGSKLKASCVTAPLTRLFVADIVSVPEKRNSSDTSTLPPSVLHGLLVQASMRTSVLHGLLVQASMRMGSAVAVALVAANNRTTTVAAPPANNCFILPPLDAR